MRLANDKALADLLRKTSCKVAGQGAKAAAVAPRAKGKPATRSALETALQAQIEASDLPRPEYDVCYLIGSRHRLDVCWPAVKVGVEVQGSVHRIKGKHHADIVKRALGQMQGWLVIEVDAEAIKSGQALTWIRQLLK